MKSSKELKAIAKEGLQGKRGQSIGAMFIYLLLSAIPLCSPALLVGYHKYNVSLIRKEQTSAGDVCEGFSFFGKALWLSIISSFFIFLWSLLLFVPGIIKAFSYSMAPYILGDNPQMTAREALRESKKLMAGKKGKLFWLGLTFIGWSLVGIITLGIGFIWICPYIQATYAAFYNEAITVSVPQNAPEEVTV
jgi:uncharacterized membrane protein